MFNVLHTELDKTIYTVPVLICNFWWLIICYTVTAILLHILIILCIYMVLYTYRYPCIVVGVFPD